MDTQGPLQLRCDPIRGLKAEGWGTVLSCAVSPANGQGDPARRFGELDQNLTAHGRVRQI